MSKKPQNKLLRAPYNLKKRCCVVQGLGTGAAKVASIVIGYTAALSALKKCSRITPSSLQKWQGLISTLSVCGTSRENVTASSSGLSYYVLLIGKHINLIFSKSGSSGCISSIMQ